MKGKELEQLIQQLEGIDPESIQPANGPVSPELASRLLKVRDHLQSILLKIDALVAGDYRTAPLTDTAPEQAAIVPVTQAIQPADSAEPGYTPEEKEYFSNEKLEILQTIKHPRYKALLQTKLDKLSVESLKLLRKLDYIYSIYYNYRLDDFSNMYYLLSDLDTVVGTVIDKIAGVIPDRPEREKSGNGESAELQHQALKPYVNYLLSELATALSKKSKIINIKFAKADDFFTDRWAFLQDLKKLFTSCPQELFTKKCYGHDSTSPGWFVNHTRIALWLAGFRNFCKFNQSKFETLLPKILRILPKFQDTGKWWEQIISGDDRRWPLLKLILHLSPEQVESLDATLCTDFLCFMADKDASRHFEGLAEKEQIAFILGRDYSHQAMVKILSAGT